MTALFTPLRKLILAALIAALTASTAMAFTNFDGGFGKFGARGKWNASTPAVLCSPQMNGKFDLTVTCNNIYLLTGVI